MVLKKKIFNITESHFYNYVGPKVGTVGSTSGGPNILQNLDLRNIRPFQGLNSLEAVYFSRQIEHFLTYFRKFKVRYKYVIYVLY